jgi:hypothetical protein
MLVFSSKPNLRLQASKQNHRVLSALVGSLFCGWMTGCSGDLETMTIDSNRKAGSA